MASTARDFCLVTLSIAVMWMWVYLWSSSSLGKKVALRHLPAHVETLRNGSSTTLSNVNPIKASDGPSTGSLTNNSGNNSNAKRSEYRHAVKNTLFYEEKVLNRSRFNYIYSNSDLCSRNTNGSVFLVVMVPTRPGEIARREAIRKTWGNITHVSGKPIVVVFLLANTTDANTEFHIAKENKAHRDLCMKDFMDTYNNLTHKTMMGLDWVNTFCRSTQFALKIDSDMMPNLENLVNHLTKLSNTTLFEGHLMKRTHPVRSRSGYVGKWFVSLDEYPHPTYPPYELGAAYLMSGDLVHQAVSISPHVPYFHIEDVYIGMLMKTLGVMATEDHRFTQKFLSLQSKQSTYYSLCYFTKVFTLFSFESVDKLYKFWTLWSEFDPRPCLEN
ncbi:beta-1,3-galactosyltransferase 5-like [Amphiura filiformis]|uniref:beta-1,3-galactosyltransferase 5-like n=1 Tax=Amphiura filiformis TaxID=82378 RepID=UPI003B2195BD